MRPILLFKKMSRQIILSNEKKMSDRTQINLKQLKLKTIASEPMKVLILGPSISRKNACIQDIISHLWDEEDQIVAHTTHEELWPPKSQLVLTSNIGKAIGSEISVIENPETFDVSLLEDAITNGKKTIIALNDYSFSIPKALANKLTHIMVLGGVQGLRSLWDDFGALVPKFRDFRQIFLACTDEGDRYSDDFLVIRVDAETKDPNQVLFWGSLRKLPAKNITMNIDRSIILNKVHTVETVQIPTLKDIKEERVVVEETPVVIKEKEVDDNEENDDEREPRGECTIL